MPEKETFEKIQEAFKRHFQKFQCRHLLASKEIRDVQIYSGPLKILGKRFIYAIIEDITEKKRLENVLRESEERYRQIVDLIPYAIIISVDSKIVLANKKAYKTFNDLIGENVYKFAPDFKDIISKRVKQILENKNRKTVYDYRVKLKNNETVDIEVCSSYLNYKGKPGILSIIKDITKGKKELNAAARMQEQLFKKPFAIPDKAKIEILYTPARTVSGDFFYFSKVNENLLVGIIGDVSGKGITAALSISAFNVLFHEAVLVSKDPSEIVNNLNRKVVNYLGDRYVAVSCFSFDFRNNEAKIVGAGINQFIFQNNINNCKRKIVRGPFLGMFNNGIFDEQIIRFKAGDRFYFFTDGLDFIFHDDRTNNIILDIAIITELIDKLKCFLNEMLTDVDGIQDDCTLIAMEIK